jgi:hypothetical protein
LARDHRDGAEVKPRLQSDWISDLVKGAIGDIIAAILLWRGFIRAIY